MAKISFEKFTLIIILSIVFISIAGAIFYQKFETENIFRESLNEYISTNLGIKFQYAQWFTGTVIEQGNRIFPDHDQMSLPITDWSFMDYIAVFEKPEDEQIEDSIKDIIKQEGKKLENCQITKINHWAHPEYESLIISLANPVTSYSETELEEIKQADIQAKEDGGPFNGEYEKRIISNKRLINLCSEYATGNSRIPSMFLYNKDASKTKFIFLPATNDLYFHNEGTIEFLDNNPLFFMKFFEKFKFFMNL
ncbi:hypothetical protein CL656_04030 [bacterium]|nr:hypothetical protein [bacterium]|tara:strand:- start:728 stop:1483 length:756 start_codon:yes stop_codon:yes gene_type:complete